MLTIRTVALTSLSFVAALVSANAALPPQHQRVIELRAIIGDSGVTSRFDIGHPIEKIEWISHDLYRVTGGNCTLDVTIASDPSWHPPRGWVGPRHFVVAPGKLLCH